MASGTTAFSNNNADVWLRDVMSDCVLCPRTCHVNRLAGQIGYCGQTSELMAARASLHYWEEPCISGISGSGTVFFSGCNLRCVFCQNHNIALGKAGRVITPKHLVEIFLNLQEQGANNINLVTPTHFLPQIAIALEQAKCRGLHLPIVYNTGSYESMDALRHLEGLVDIYLPDLKYLSAELSTAYSHAPDYFEIACAAIAEMYRQVGDPVIEDDEMKRGVLVRHLVLPGCVDGVLTGCILAVGRILGETAALLYTAGFAHALYGSLTETLHGAGATLSVALYVYAKEQGEFEVAFAIAAILMMLALLIDLAASLTGRYFKKRRSL